MNSLSSISKEDKVTYSKAAAMVILVLIVFGSWLWWRGVYTSKDDVFKAMLANSLSTTGVTKLLTRRVKTARSIKKPRLSMVQIT
jgi:hypothetical protein